MFQMGQKNPWVGKISWRRKWQPTPVVLPGKELDTTEQATSLGGDGSDKKGTWGRGRELLYFII